MSAQLHLLHGVATRCSANALHAHLYMHDTACPQHLMRICPAGVQAIEAFRKDPPTTVFLLTKCWCAGNRGISEGSAHHGVPAVHA